MKYTKKQLQQMLDGLPPNYKTADVDRVIRELVKAKADVSCLRPYVLQEQQFHRLYFYVHLAQLKNAPERMVFIHNNLLLSEWWHTDQLIRYVADLDFAVALEYARDYVLSDDPFIRRWGYVLFISRLCKGRAQEILPLTHDDDHYYVQMAQAWLIAELFVYEPERVYAWLQHSDLNYNITGKAIQKIIDSFRIADSWKAKCRALRPMLKEGK